MRKTLLILLAILLISSIIGCASTESQESASSEPTASQQTDTEKQATDEALKKAEAEALAAKEALEKANAEKVEAEKKLAEAKSAEEKEAAEKALAEAQAIEKAAKEAAAKALVEKEAAKAAADKALADKTAADKALVDKATADKAALEKLNAEIPVPANGYTNGKLLVDVAWVASNKDKIRIIDARSKGFAEGHIPSATSFNINTLNDPKSSIQGFLLSAEGITPVFQNAGINQNDTIVIYDEGNALSASRLFYALEYYGHKKVKILNGGYAGWLVAGKEISTDKPQVKKGDFVATPIANLTCSLEDVKKSQTDNKFLYLDARSEKEYTGEDLRAKNGGHIPGAVNIEWNQAIKTNDAGVSVFKSLAELYTVYGKLDITKTIIPYCQTNVRGAHSYFTLRLMGFQDVRPYEGSWAEYGNVENVKIDQGK
jgi:thiosulfate/3-mercaptopyruvate sulfurtransferase